MEENDYNENTGCGVIFFAVLILLCGYALGYFTRIMEIVATEKISPEIRLVVSDNKVDTLFIYKPLKK